MQDLFSTEGQAALSAIMAVRPLLAFDFDGTLAPIVDRPGDARVPKAVAQRLERLARRLPLAIVSGRGVEDLRARLPFQPRYLIGSHGAEEAEHLPRAKSADFDAMRARLAAHAQALRAAGVTVEDKRYSIALHYRLARDPQAARELLVGLLADAHEAVRVVGGKMVLNLVSAAAPDKAQAVAELVRRSGARGAVYLGDDVNDEPVFSRREPGWLTVRVGCDDPGSQAAFCLDGPGQLPALLDRMLALLDDAKGYTDDPPL